MTTRKKVRPDLPDEILEGIHSDAEFFQNEVLRPVIKMQSDLLVTRLHTALATMKVDFTLLTPFKKKELLTHLFQKDQSFKREIIGMVIGQFTLQEYQQYVPLQKELNRRIVQIVLNRCIDQLV